MRKRVIPRGCLIQARTPGNGSRHSGRAPVEDCCEVFIRSWKISGVTAEAPEKRGGRDFVQVGTATSRANVPRFKAHDLPLLMRNGNQNRISIKALKKAGFS